MSELFEMIAVDELGQKVSAHKRRIEATEQAILYLNVEVMYLRRMANLGMAALLVLALLLAASVAFAQEMPDKCAKDWHQFLQDHPDERVIFTGDDENGQPVFKILAQPGGGMWRLIVLAAAEEPKRSCVITSGPSWIGLP